MNETDRKREAAYDCVLEALEGVELGAEVPTGTLAGIVIHALVKKELLHPPIAVYMHRDNLIKGMTAVLQDLLFSHPEAMAIRTLSSLGIIQGPTLITGDEEESNKQANR